MIMIKDVYELLLLTQDQWLYLVLKTRIHGACIYATCCHCVLQNCKENTNQVFKSYSEHRTVWIVDDEMSSSETTLWANYLDKNIIIRLTKLPDSEIFVATSIFLFHCCLRSAFWTGLCHCMRIAISQETSPLSIIYNRYEIRCVFSS